MDNSMDLYLLLSPNAWFKAYRVAEGDLSQG